VVKSSPPSSSVGGLARRPWLRRRGRAWGRPQLVGQRLDAGFAGDLALGAALLLERQVQVFQLLLGRREFDGGAQLGRELALLVDALEHGFAAVFELAQVARRASSSRSWMSSRPSVASLR
jgi:hypothetical protein